MTFHHLHEKDLALLADLEDEIHRENVSPQKSVLNLRRLLTNS